MAACILDPPVERGPLWRAPAPEAFELLPWKGPQPNEPRHSMAVPDAIPLAPFHLLPRSADGELDPNGFEIRNRNRGMQRFIAHPRWIFLFDEHKGSPH
jgi:hypothetical protein